MIKALCALFISATLFTLPCHAAPFSPLPLALLSSGSAGAGEEGANTPGVVRNATLDAVLIPSGALLWAGSVIFENSLDIQPEPGYNKSDVNAFDRFFMPGYGYSRPLDIAGDAGCAASLALPVLAYGITFGTKRLSGRDTASLTLMYVEALFWSQGLKTILKAAVHRVRPYMYGTSRPDDWADGVNFSESFPSGHTTSAFTGASFLTYTFCKYFPASRWKIPVIVTSYAFAVSTGVLRVASGNHFVTDVLAGAALGALCGIGVPLLHEAFSRASGDKVEIAALPLGLSVTFAL